MAAKSKKYFLLDYRFIIYIYLYILFISVFFSVVSMQDGCFASVMLKSIIALLLSLAADGIFITRQV